MYEHVMVETLSGRLMLFGGGGGNAYSVMFNVHAATLRRLTFFILCLI